MGEKVKKKSVFDSLLDAAELSYGPSGPAVQLLKHRFLANNSALDFTELQKRVFWIWNLEKPSFARSLNLQLFR